MRDPVPTVSMAPDPEVTARHARRRFTTAYKLEILRKADGCTQPGQIGALLRKEGLYSSHVTTWRRQREAGLTAKTRGRPVTTDPRVKQLEREKAALEATTRRLERQLERAATIIAFQKNAHARWPHPRWNESGSVSSAREPGQGRHLLVPRARKKMDPSAAPQAPRTVALVPQGDEEHAR